MRSKILRCTACGRYTLKDDLPRLRGSCCYYQAGKILS